MFRPARSHGRALHAVLRPSARLSLNVAVAGDVGRASWNTPLQRRWNWTRPSRNKAHHSFYEAEYPTAEKLLETGIFTPRTKSARTRPGADGNRVNLVNPKLADDVIEYIRPSLERHKGCDLITMYPGAGLFTKALHDAVQPRSHILLEPDEQLYAPYLEPLLSDPAVTLLPKSGIVWQELQEILTPKYLPHQVEIDRRDFDTDPPRNDTLLVHMNLAMYPKRKYGLFDSLSRMVLYQLISSVRTSTLFQKYGLVRMLVWVPDEEKDSVIPRVLQARKKGAIEAEMVTEYIAEVCGKDGTLDDETVVLNSRSTIARPHQFNLESLRQTLVRMKEAGHVTPPGRQTRLLRQFGEEKKSLSRPIPLTREAFTADKGFYVELADMRAQKEQGLIAPGTKEAARLKMLSHYNTWLDKLAVRLLDFIQRSDAVAEQYSKAEQARADGERERAQELLDKAVKANDKYNAEVRKLPEYVRQSLNLMRDQLQVLRQPAGMGPVLSWDRRPWEPLKVQAAEFFPNQPCALIDIQPKAPDRLLRHIGPGTSNAGDIFDLMLSSIMRNTLVTLADNMDHVWPGASEGLRGQCRTVHDPAMGGSPLTGEAAPSARAANQAQLLDLLREFLRWPFMPTYHELVGRLEDDGLVDDASFGFDEEGPAGMNLGNTTGDAFY
ncbi:hypothetical protein KVR01_007691 [Diaporthe batatas]|uniref:uncharacterized protein n=1 Tax=Diaporthe batatas TaxID=748121 RepID=UPI001D0416F5|nr:uncharacterized protein KVR01_007691 [Diaporthe batatas]KAG8161926.1 hypothetical protein KVR01_007691 [Diaporthe batatas]